jgi:hypothetical protein
MKRKMTMMATVIILSSSVLFSSCVGSFSLFNRVLKWNQSVNDDWVNELLFVLLWIVPVYEVSGVIDAVVLNSVEFWTGENPMETSQTQEVKTENGDFTITTDAKGHKIQKEGSDEVVEFRFNKGENSWSLVFNEVETPLFQYIDNQQAKVYLADGSTMNVQLNQAGVMAFKQVMENKAYFANK